MCFNIRFVLYAVLFCSGLAHPWGWLKQMSQQNGVGHSPPPASSTALLPPTSWIGKGGGESGRGNVKERMQRIATGVWAALDYMHGDDTAISKKGLILVFLNTIIYYSMYYIYLLFGALHTHCLEHCAILCMGGGHHGVTHWPAILSDANPSDATWRMSREWKGQRLTHHQIFLGGRIWNAASCAWKSWAGCGLFNPSCRDHWSEYTGVL